MICRLAYGNVDSTRVTGSVYKQNNGLKERSPVAILLGVTYRGKRLPAGQPFLFCTTVSIGCLTWGRFVAVYLPGTELGSLAWADLKISPIFWANCIAHCWATPMASVAILGCASAILRPDGVS